MRIARVAASVHRPRTPGEAGGYAGRDSAVFVWCRVETADGLVGDGFTGRFLAAEVAHFLDGALGEAVTEAPLPDDPIPALAARFNPRGMTGVVVSALSALDVALHDLRGKAAGKPVAALLGTPRAGVPVHVTCGLPHLDIDALAGTCRAAVAAGADGVKMVVGAGGRPWREDAERVHAVRDAVGPAAELVADANGAFDLATAGAFAAAVAPCRLAWIEEPVRGNDPTALAALAAAGHPIGAGQMEQSRFRFDALLDAGRVAVIQPNAVFCGGFVEAAVVADRAEMLGRRLAPAGGWELVNLHLVAARPAGALERHAGQAAIVETITGTAPPPLAGPLRVPDAPGLGIAVDTASLERARL